MVLASIIIVITSLLISKMIYGDLMSPSILIKLPWLASLIFLLFSNFDYDSNSPIYLYFSIGIITFDLGFILASKATRRKVNDGAPKINYLVNEKLIIKIMILEIVILSIYLLSVVMYVRNNFIYNIYFSLKLGVANGTFNPSIFFGYANNFIITFTSLIVFVSRFAFFKAKNKLLFSQLLIGTLSTLLTLGRTSVLLFVITNLGLFIISKDIKNIKIIQYGSIFTIGGLVFFTIYNFLKYPYLIETGSHFQFALEGISMYLSSSLVAFEKVVNSNIELIYGDNAFRFIYAILDRIFGGTRVRPLTNEFISIGSDTTTNVYTFYYYYFKDFGLVYALMIQAILGSVYGFLYRHINSKRPIWIFLYSLSLYPLFMQFFQDQYFSLTSTWIQFIIFGNFLFNSNIFIQKIIHNGNRGYEIEKLPIDNKH